MEKGMAWFTLNILRVVKSNPGKGKHPYLALCSRCLLKTLYYTKGFPWGGSGDRELSNPAPGGCLVAQHAVRGYEGCFDTFAWTGVSHIPGSHSIEVFRVTYRLRESGMMDGNQCSKTILQTKIPSHCCAQPEIIIAFCSYSPVNFLKRSTCF